MFDKSKFEEALTQYKKDCVPNWWGDELYKWEAVKWFQDNWDVAATDFAGMLESALAKTFNLLASRNRFPGRMIVEFAQAAPEDVRAMFIALYDEKQDVYARIENFKLSADSLLKKLRSDNASHFQDENAITVYLWLRFPDRYYVYKYGEVKRASEYLESDYSFKKGAYTENLRGFYSLYQSINAELKKDPELKEILKNGLTDSCYEDPEMCTLTGDFVFYLSRSFQNDLTALPVTAGEIHYWIYAPGRGAKLWNEFYEKGIMGIDFINIGDLYDYSDRDEIAEALKKHGDPSHSYRNDSLCLWEFYKVLKPGDIIFVKNGLKTVVGKGIVRSDYYYDPSRDSYKHLRKVEWVANGEWEHPWHNMVLKTLTDITKYKGYPQKIDALIENGIIDEPEGIEASGNIQYWWLNANPKIWSFSDIAVGEVQDYTLYNENGNKRRIFQNFLDAKAGDIVIGYESNPVKQIVAIGRISAGQDGERIYFEKVEGLVSPIDYAVLKDCPELSKMEYFVNPQGSLFKLTKEEYEFIMDLIRDENPVEEDKATAGYSKEDFLNEVYMNESRYNQLVGVLLRKKNIILQGAPGVGKTFAAKRLAYSIMGEIDDNRVEFIQFHQNYSYEDFVMGYKPVENGFELRNGVFYRFCKKAENQPYEKFFFIIDEINRGNMSKIFGELLMLIEKDYRGTKATLAYNGLPFAVPENVYIIGLMNTADRSLAMIDYALRRRFSFFEVEPGFDSEGFINYQKKLHNETFDELISKVKELNREISLDRSLGKGFCVGHSYFCGQEECTDEWLQAIVDYDILPMLSEYWFDDQNKLTRWENILRGVFR